MNWDLQITVCKRLHAISPKKGLRKKLMASVKRYVCRDGSSTWRVRYKAQGRCCSTTFRTNPDAQRFVEMLDKYGPEEARIRVGQDNVDRPGDEINATGCFVYVLWGDDPVTPLYVGESENIFSRLGSHMNNPERRTLVRRVQLIECRNEFVMHATEARLIYDYRPTLNIVGKPLFPPPNPDFLLDDMDMESAA